VGDVGSDLNNLSDRITADDGLLSLRSPKSTDRVLPVRRVESNGENSSLGKGKRRKGKRRKGISLRARSKKTDHFLMLLEQGRETYEDAVKRVDKG